MLKKLFGWGKKEEKIVQEAQEIVFTEVEQTCCGEPNKEQSSAEDEEFLKKEPLQGAVYNEEPIVEIMEEEIFPKELFLKDLHITEAEMKIAENLEVENKEEIVEELYREETIIKENVQLEDVIEVEKTEKNKEPEENLPNGFFARLKQGLSKTTKNFTEKITEMFECYEGVSELVYEDLEEILIMADVGFETTNYIVDTLRKRVLDKSISDTALVKTELQQIISEILSKESAKMNIDSGPSILTIVGVNGVGKTTTIGKLANKYNNDGKKVILAAADTFRAAASEQLDIWAKRANVEIVKHGEGADPSAVIFDAIKAAKSRNADILICDTAGRLHNKKNLMMELEKIFRIIDREYEEANKEVLLVIDATTGQNAISQAKLFKEVAPITGIILTKLDGTAKGGVVLGIIQEIGLPVKYVGVGEKLNDLQEFDSKTFAKALFGED